MKTAVIYTSQTGFTKRYADWIAEKTQAEIIDLSEAQKKDASFFDSYDAVIYASWFMAGKVVKSKWFFDKAESWKDKKLAVIAVGASPNESREVPVAMNNLLTIEQSKYIKAFYCQGGLNYEKMKLPSKLALKMFVGALKKSKDPKQREQGDFLDHSYDISDIKFIDPVIAYLGE